MITKRQLALRLTRLLEEQPGWLEMVRVVRANSRGRRWLIGSAVFQRLAHILYEAPLPDSDYDFLVEKGVRTPKRLPGWCIKKNRYGNPKWVKGGLSFDLVPLAFVHPIRLHRRKPSLQNYLRHTPLTVQSIAFDTSTHQLHGRRGLQSIFSQTLSVNDSEQFAIASRKKEKGSNWYLAKRARRLRFRIV